MISPIALFVYNRPEHLEKTIHSLSKNNLAIKSDLYIFSDGPKTAVVEQNVSIVRKFILTLEKKKIFNSVNIHFEKKNKGLANSIIDGVTEVIKKYGKVIVIEDDLVFSKYFLNFMNDSLNFYEKNKEIWSINGYSPPIKIPNNYNKDIYLSYRGNSWGWATWSDRWGLIDWKIRDYDTFLNDKIKVNNFLRGGYDLLPMLRAQMNSKIDSWAVRWCYNQSKFHKYSITPIKSYVANYGLDGSGTHSPITQKYNIFINDNPNYSLMSLEVNKVIIKKLKSFYLSYLQFLFFELIRIIKFKKGNKV